MLKVVPFFRYTFLGKLVSEPGRKAKISVFFRKKIPDDTTLKTRPGGSDTQCIKSQTVLFVNWVFGLVLGLCLIAMIAYALIYKSESVPTYISTPFYMILGWFGHAYTSFLELEKRR
jgi:hypothetical protein